MKIDREEWKLGHFFLITLGFTWLFWIPDALSKKGVLPDVIWTNPPPGCKDNASLLSDWIGRTVRVDDGGYF